jgi:predicted RNA-binding protein YlxR (DUF448 family)
MAKRGHKPQRTCLGCGARDVQDRMIRLAVTGQDKLLVEQQRGRGGYLHRDAKCQKAFVTRKGHYRAFHVEVNRTAKAKLIDSLTDRDGE